MSEILFCIFVSNDDCFRGARSLFILFDWINLIQKQIFDCIRQAITSFNFKVLLRLANDYNLR